MTDENKVTEMNDVPPATPDITKVIEDKFSELKTEINGVSRKVEQIVANPPPPAPDPEPEPDLDPTDPVQVNKLVDKKVDEKLNEREARRKYEADRIASDQEATKEFPWLKDQNSKECQLAKQIWQRKFGNTEGPVDALMQVALEAKHIMDKEARMSNRENDTREEKGSINGAGGTPPAPKPKGNLSQSQKDYCEKFGISEEQYRKQLDRRANRYGSDQ